MSTYSYGTTTAGSTYGITISPTQAETRPKTPAGLVVTQAVQTRDGWLGQVIVDKDIVWESPAQDDGEGAVKAANARVVEAFKQLFQLVEAVEEAETDR